MFQASYADIARHAAALYTQQVPIHHHFWIFSGVIIFPHPPNSHQAGQQQTAVYREALQCRETTPASSGGNNKESVSSAEGDSISFHYSSTSAHTGPDEHHGHTLTRAASEPSDSYRPPLPAPERSPLPAPERASLVPAAPPSQQLQSLPSSKVKHKNKVALIGKHKHHSFPETSLISRNITLFQEMSLISRNVTPFPER